MKIREAFADPLQGIFVKLGELFPEKYPWADEYVDIAYFARSGGKTVAPIVEQIVEHNLPASYGSPIETLCRIIDKKYGVSWKHLYDILSAEYNPIENYSMVENETPDITRQIDTQTDAEGDSKASGYGFNSEAPVPNAESDATSSQTASSTERETGNRRLTRSGNIGVTTSQQMIESEIELWKWAYLDTIFAQLDSLITCPLYEY